MRRSKVLLAAVTLVMVTTSARAADLFVSLSGNDANSGSASAPFRTIKAASKVAKPGDVVNVRAGVYPDVVSISSKGTASAPIVFRPAAGETVVLDGSSLAAGTDIVTLNATDYVDFTGFEVRNSPKIGITLWHARNSRVIGNHVHHTRRNGIYAGGDTMPSCYSLTVEGNSVHDTVLENQTHSMSGGGWAGAVVVSRTEGASIRGNRIWNNDGEGLISLRSNHHVIEDNEITDSFSVNLYLDNSRFAVVNGNLIRSGNSRYFRDGKPASGISVANETTSVMNPSSDNVFTNNIVIGTRWGFYYGNYESGGGLRNSKVLNNTFYGTTDAIIEITADTHSNSVVQNNIFFATTSPDPRASGSGAGVTYANNLWYGGNAGAAAGAGDVVGNPLLANAGGTTSADYRVRSGSAAVARALNVLSVVPSDYFGTTRVAPVDIGAHQLGAAVSDTTAPSIPLNVRATGGAIDFITLAWDASSDNVGVTSYIVLRNGTAVASVAGTTWTDRSVAANTMYRYQVQAVDAANNKSAASVVLSVAWSSSPATTPESPVLTIVDRSSSSLTLQWTAGDTAVSFLVYRDGVEIASVTGLDYVDTDLLPSTSYTYTVVAVDAEGNVSEPSNEASAQTSDRKKARAARG